MSQRQQARNQPLAEAFVAGTRWWKVAFFVGLSALAVFIFVRLRRDPELDLEDWLWTAVFLVLAAWVVAQGLGLTVRRLLAGHALRFAAARIHYPGWDPIPLSAVTGLRVEETTEKKQKKHTLVIDVDPACRAAQRGSYERWAFGPVEGLRAGKPLRIGLASLHVTPEALRAACDHWRPRRR